MRAEDEKEIRYFKTGNGHTIIIDKEDYDRVKDTTWTGRGKKCIRPTTHIYRNGKRTTEQLAYFILPKKPGLVLDHINHNPLDNRKCNLRYCTKAENNRNSRGKGSASGYKGIRFKKNRWEVSIEVGNKAIYLGRYIELQEAIKVYNQSALQYFGEFACLNEVPNVSRG